MGDLDGILDSLRTIAADGNAGWTTLPPAAFGSDALFALEQERVFKAGWICVGRADQVAHPGDYMALDVVGEPIVLVRDLAGELRVLSNLCRHRWMSVCLGSGNAKVLSCPYHAWTYRLDGRLWAAPEMDRHPTFDKTKVALPPIRHAVWQGFVYVNLDGGAELLAPQLAPVDARIAAYDLAGWVTAATQDCGEYPWDWKVMQDNGECYHHLGLHRDTFEANYPGRASGTWDNGGIFTYLWAPARPETRVKGGDGLDYVPGMEFPPMPGLDEGQRTSFLLVFVLPNFFIYLQPDLVMNMRVFPVAAGRIRLFADFIVRPEARALPDFQARLDRAIAFFNRFNDEDVVANSAIQRNLGSRFAAAAPLSTLEHHNRHFARWVAKQLTG
ncbi:MAG: aromatic ring-hydroxylating dioxygenase subunit alpha [Alphaproteobacteria bacterium]|nr:aromatic ring-hydroxylating dioxygenase subunit alpha [Alphaproteobacteria bacterium]